MNRNFFRTCTIAGAIGLFGLIAACTDTPTSAPTPRIGPTETPAYDASTPFNNAGQCMADDAVRAPNSTIPGVKFGGDPLTASNCTSNDVRIATAQVINYLLADSLGNFSGTPIPFDSTTNVTCTVNQGIQLTMSAKLNETATSTRSDIGIWLATDGGRGVTGACNHYNLPTNPLTPGTGVSNADNDSCGDLNAGAVVPSFPLGTFNAVCVAAGGAATGRLHIGSCLGWTEPGANRVCPLPDASPTAPNWATESPDGYRFGTLYGNQAKCNCEGFDVPITVIRPPNVAIVKTADAASVNAGSQIGFTVTVSNTGPGSATNLAVSDPLPAGTGVSWSIETPVTGWSITGTAPNQTLAFSSASFGITSSSVHVISGTTSASCQLYSNTATVTLGNGTAPSPATATTTVGCPTIGITKLPATQTKNAGESFSWTVVLTNNGPGTATAAAINDPLPVLTGVTYTLGAGSDATCAITAGTLTCGPKDLAASGTITAVIDATTTAGTSCSSGGFTNTATGSATGVSNVQASATTILNCPTIGITKLPATQTKNAGESFSWTVVLTNSGLGTAVGATISDPLPVVTGVGYTLGAGSDATCAITAGTLTCGPKDLAQNGTITAVIDATTTAGTSCSSGGFTNTATGKATGVSDVTASATTILNCPSIGITKTPATQTKSAGEGFSWTVTLTNSGAGTAVGANINDPLPVVTGVSYTLDASSDATCAITAGTLTCGPKDLAQNATIVAIINATTTAGTSCSSGGFTNTATGKATGVSDVTASATTILNCPSIGITKTPSSQTVASGSPFSWTVTLTNSGAGTAVGAAINDPLPVVAGVNYSLGSSSPAGANCAITSGTLACGPLDLAPNGTITAVINATTTAGSGCSSSGFTNTATGSATGVSNVQASATTTLTCPEVNALIAPTQTTCEQFAIGSAPAEPFLSAGLKGSVINNVSPGVVFYFAKLTVPAGATLNILQSDTRADGKSPPFPLIQVASGQAQVKTFNANTNQCSLVGTFNLSNPNAPTITLANAGTYVVQIKYSPNSLTGYSIPNPPVDAAFPVHYVWGAQVNGGSTVGSAAIDLNKK
ncbi:MAG: beta strand repeat-containing protein [Gemmatimonadaceae bacterium]